ncbi:Flp pilus assembly protein TadD [Microbacteriaceae bacterium SG_E_30_P1]|uniref:Flp pilus assembly protein TadD n=1 Tax=Antiquaquibacter oligotrophicus TaxID=2880260 RepID=A0ABT6KR36_9MICO|nr:tetratricopeptide repeat protein [Antiquaquibacter oligotrophicus]MDH6182445.1 Flp pilus assembly protein TadD [Antiquaquibacter oligotrophicus]UDF14584.1 tetratricopeptide repeat protein [Antiquaquibacter oligotrophicus]
MTSADGGAPDPVELALQRARLLADVGRFDDALGVIGEVLGSAPDHEELIATRGWLLLKLGRAAEAREALGALVAAQPNTAWTLYLLSAAELSLENIPAARKAADRALELEPQHPRYHLQVGYAAVAGSISGADRRVAEERVASALELGPDIPRTYEASAEIYRALGETEKAKEFVARGLALAPDDQSLHFLRAVLAGDYTPTSSKDYGGYAFAANQVAAMGEVLGMSPGNVEASQVVFGRVWAQLLRLIDAPLIMLGVVTIGIGAGMGNGPGLQNLYWAAIFAVVWPLFRLVLARLVISRAPKGYVRRMIRPIGSGVWRVVGSLTATAIGLLGVAALLWLRDAALVRVLLLLIVAGAVAGGVASVFWQARYFTAARESGIFQPGELGYRSVRIARKGLNAQLVRRCVMLALVSIVALLISRMTRADAAPVLLIITAAWVAPSIAAVLMVRRISRELGDTEYAPEGVKPSVVAGAFVGITALALGAVVVAAGIQLPWAPSDRDSAGVYTPHDERSDVFDECTGRPANRFACVIDKQQERIDQITEDMEEIEIPDFDFPDLPELDPDGTLPDVTVPEVTPAPEVVVP